MLRVRLIFSTYSAIFAAAVKFLKFLAYPESVSKNILFHAECALKDIPRMLSVRQTYFSHAVYAQKKFLRTFSMHQIFLQ
jgi:hypothetical protein